jgi:hypothetical protein
VRPFTEAMAGLSRVTLHVPGEFDVGGVTVIVF